MIKNQSFFLPGSEWLYYKLYMGSQTSESFLTLTLKPLINRLLDEKIIDKWFFINYADPQKHIRIRFHLVDNNLKYLVNSFNKVLNYYIEEKLINDIQISLYKREFVRYGKNTIQEFETLFFLNSMLVVNILENVSENPNKRWLWCLKSIDSFMNSWGLSLANKKDLFELLSNSYGQEMNTNTSINRQLSLKYRKHRKSISNIIENGDDVIDGLLVDYRRMSQASVDSILNKRPFEKTEDLIDVLEGYIHMHCNRIFVSKPRMNEWVIYYFLYHYYRGQIARKNQNKK